MGTNFYTFEHYCETCARFDRGEHVGKRSAAGMFCWDCGVALVEGGNSQAHTGAPSLEKCPRCRKRPKPKGLDEPGHAVGIELGFARSNVERPKGVSSASSFLWGIEPEKARELCEASLDAPCIVNEYGERFTGREFLEMLRCQCPIERTHMIGREFS